MVADRAEPAHEALNMLAMDRLTLRFSSATVEQEICKHITRSTYAMNMWIVGFLLLQHIVISIFRPALFTISAVYIPICTLFLVIRWRIHHLVHPFMAYMHNQWTWFFLIILGTATQRACFALGLHPFLTLGEASISTLYHFHWGIVSVMLHLQLVSIELRVAMEAAMFLSLATANWDSGDGWTYHGQPNDTINIGTALTMGELIGYFAERLIREKYLETYAEMQRLRSQLQDDEELLDELAAEGVLAGGCCLGSQLDLEAWPPTTPPWRAHSAENDSSTTHREL